MKELDTFERVHGVRLEIGLRVKIDHESEWAADWTGDFIVRGINALPGNSEGPCRIDVTISDDWSDGGTDGWSPGDLVPSRG